MHAKIGQPALWCVSMKSCMPNCLIIAAQESAAGTVSVRVSDCKYNAISEARTTFNRRRKRLPTRCKAPLTIFVFCIKDLLRKLVAAPAQYALGHELSRKDWSLISTRGSG